MPVRDAKTIASHGLGLRHPEERRVTQRRYIPRLGSERRRGDRRRHMLVSLMATGLSLGWHAAPQKTLLRPQVDVSVSNIIPIEANRAYDNLVVEAASTFGLDPALLRPSYRPSPPSIHRPCRGRAKPDAAHT